MDIRELDLSAFKSLPSLFWPLRSETESAGVHGATEGFVLSKCPGTSLASFKRLLRLTEIAGLNLQGLSVLRNNFLKNGSSS